MVSANTPGMLLRGIQPYALHFFIVVDTSHMMSGNGKMQALNTAMREMIFDLQAVASMNPKVRVYVRAITYSHGARWHVPTPTPVEQFIWTDATAGGWSDMGAALSLVADALKFENIEGRNLPPVILLISASHPTDDYMAGVRAVMEQPLGRKAVRLAIKIGNQADETSLIKFLGNRYPEIPILEAHNPHEVVNYIKWGEDEIAEYDDDQSSDAAQKPIPVPSPKDAYDLPGGQLGRKPVQLIFMIDCSRLMLIDGKMQALNNAMRELIPHLRAAAAVNYGFSLYVRVITFAHGASWQNTTPTPLEQFAWTDLAADGWSDMGAAFSLAAAALNMYNLPNRGRKPILVLISGSYPTDDYQIGLHALISQPWGKKAVRLAVAVGSTTDSAVLTEFIGNNEIPILKVHELTHILRSVVLEVLTP